MKPTRIEPGPGQESVWDYPRPPALRRSRRHVVVVFRDVRVADTTRGLRVLETSHPPVYYIPPEDVRGDLLRAEPQRSFCEWKGAAEYVTLRVGNRQSECCGWRYPRPSPPFEPIRDHVAFYPGRVDRCLVDGEEVRPQPGGFYGGWITADVVGPFKGDPGTDFW